MSKDTCSQFKFLGFRSSVSSSPMCVQDYGIERQSHSFAEPIDSNRAAVVSPSGEMSTYPKQVMFLIQRYIHIADVVYEEPFY